MAVYNVFLEDTLMEDTTTRDFTMDYIADPESSCRIYKDGLLLALNSDYTISNKISRPYTTTFTVTFVQPMVAGSVMRVEKDEEWNQWIQFQFPLVGSRLDALEAQLTTATNVAARLTALELAVTSLQNSLIITNNNISALDARLTPIEIDVSDVEGIVNGHTGDIAAIQDFVGVVGSISIDNNVSSPIVINEFTTDGYDFSSVKIDYEISRMVGTEYRSSVGTMYLVCKENGVWYTERGLQVIDLDGVTFSIVTNAFRIGTVSYVSDNMLGAGYQGKLKFRTIKFGV